MANTNINYTAKDKEIGAMELGCSMESDTPPEVICEHGGIQIGPTQMVGTVYDIPPERGSALTFEVISGSQRKPNPHLLRVFGILQANCDKHKDSVITCFLNDAPPIRNSNGDNDIPIQYPYADQLSALWRSPVTKAALRINTCKYRTEKIDVLVYPDRKWSFKFSLDGSASIKGELKWGASGTFGLELNSGLDKFEGKIAYADALGPDGKRPDDMDDRLSVEMTVTIGRFEISKPWTSIRSLASLSRGDLSGPLGKVSKAIQIVRIVHDSVYKVNTLIKLLKEMPPVPVKKSATPHTLSVSKVADYSWSSSYEIRVGTDGYPEAWECSEITIDGTLFKITWTWDITKHALSIFGGLSGRILSHLNEQAKGKDLGGLTVTVGASGALKTDNLIRRKTYTRPGRSDIIEKAPTANLKCDINIKLEIKADIRTDAVTMYTASGEISGGCTYDLDPPKFYNNALVLKFVVFKEAGGGELCMRPGAEAKISAECKKKKVEYVNSQFTVFKEKELWGA